MRQSKVTAAATAIWEDRKSGEVDFEGEYNVTPDHDVYEYLIVDWTPEVQRAKPGLLGDLRSKGYTESGKSQFKPNFFLYQIPKVQAKRVRDAAMQKYNDMLGAGMQEAVAGLPGGKFALDKDVPLSVSELFPGATPD